MKKLKNILIFWLLLFVFPLIAYFLFSLWTDQELGKYFYQNACSLFIICYLVRKPFLNHIFRPQGRFEYWVAFSAFYFSSFYLLGLILMIF